MSMFPVQSPWVLAGQATTSLANQYGQTVAQMAQIRAQTEQFYDALDQRDRQWQQHFGILDREEKVREGNAAYLRSQNDKGAAATAAFLKNLNAEIERPQIPLDVAALNMGAGPVSRMGMTDFYRRNPAAFDKATAPVPFEASVINAMSQTPDSSLIDREAMGYMIALARAKRGGAGGADGLTGLNHVPGTDFGYVTHNGHLVGGGQGMFDKDTGQWSPFQAGLNPYQQFSILNYLIGHSDTVFGTPEQMEQLANALALRAQLMRQKFPAPVAAPGGTNAVPQGTNAPPRGHSSVAPAYGNPWTPGAVGATILPPGYGYGYGGLPSNQFGMPGMAPTSGPSVQFDGIPLSPGVEDLIKQYTNR